MTDTRLRTVYTLRPPGRNLGKTNPLNDADLAEFVQFQKTHANSPKSWSVDAKTIDPATFDLSVKNPNGGTSAPVSISRSSFIPAPALIFAEKKPD